MSLQTVRAEYKTKMSKKPYYKWNEQELRKRMTGISIPVEYPEMTARVGKTLMQILKKQDPPVFKDGKPYLIVGNSYVPYEKGVRIKLMCMKQFIDDQLSIN